MKKPPLFALAAAVALFAGVGPALAGDRDHVGFSFGIVVNDGGRGYHGGPRGYYERERYEREHCHDGDRYGAYGRSYGYAPRGQVIIVERGHGDGYRHGWHRGWDD